MSLKLDRFTGIVIALVAALLIAAVVTVNVTGGAEATLDYVSDDGPATPVYNAFVARQRGDLERMREQYSQRVLEEADGELGSNGPFRGGYYGDSSTQSRLRIVDVTISESNADSATVTYAQDRYSGGGGLFGSNTYTYRNTVEVVREEGAWKINVAEYFY